MTQVLLAENETLPTRRPLSGRRAGDEILVRDAESGQIHFLSASAAIIWECCDGATTAAQCMEKIRARFDVPGGTDLLADVRATVASLSDRGLLARA